MFEKDELSSCVKKVVIIDTCSNCPHCYEMFPNYSCNISKKEIYDDAKEVIPLWCPLTDANNS